VAGLSKQRGNDGFNFETVLACLEELDEFKIRQTSPKVWDRVGGVLSAFVDFPPDLVALKESSFLVAHWSLINGVSEFVTKRTAASTPDQLKAFFDLLRDEFDLTVATPGLFNALNCSST